MVRTDAIKILVQLAKNELILKIGENCNCMIVAKSQFNVVQYLRNPRLTSSARVAGNW